MIQGLEINDRTREWSDKKYLHNVMNKVLFLNKFAR